MKSFITGFKGQLGYDLAKELCKRGENEITVSDRSELDEEINKRSISLMENENLNYSSLDITDKDAVIDLIKSVKPDVIFHCAAWTNVDGAEDNYDACYKVNVIGTKNLTEAAREIGAKIIYISSDYVFDGTKEGTYSETDKTNPLNTYGKTKFLGEEEVRKYEKHYVVRISWVYGINGNNFVKTMLKLSESHNTLTVVNDQIGSPTYTKDVSRLLVDMAKTDKYGTYHGTNEDYCSWADFAREIFKINKKDVNVVGVTTEEYYRGKKIAKRPLNSKLSKEKLKNAGFDLLPTWEDALVRYSDELENEKEKKEVFVKKGNN